MTAPIVITVANHKGGVGKSTIAAHLAWYLNDQGRRTILVDLDAQANSTGTFIAKTAVPQPGGSDYLFSDAQPMPVAIPAEGCEHLRIIRSSWSCDEIDRQPALGAFFSFPERIRALDAEFVIIDTPPANGNRLNGAIAASTLVVTPFQPEDYSVAGLKTLSQEIDEIRKRLNQSLGRPVAVCNMYVKRSTLHDQFATAVKKYVLLLEPYLHRLVVVAETSSMQTPVWRLRNRGAAGAQWTSIMKQIVERAQEAKR